MILKRNVLAFALASALCAATAAHAAGVQDTGDQATPSTDSTSTQKARQKKAKVQATELTGVTVTGFRKSVETSIDVKRDADTIKEVVTAADIGGLPDVSISDALTRLPGVAAERIDGESSAINIRGLSGDFVETTLDGREQAATSGSRVTQFDQYPSELISQAAIYKSPKASLIEGGVAGTVEMQTSNPLDNAKQYSGVLNVRGSYNDRASETEGANARGYRVSASFQGKFLHDTLGLAAGLASLYQPHVADQFNGLAFNGTKDVNGDGTNEYTSEGFELQQNGGMLRRNGYMAVLQWRPSDSFELKADGFYSKFDTTSEGHGFRVKTLNNGIITNPVILPNGAVTGGTITQDPANPYFVVQTTNDDNSLKNSVLSGGLNAKWMLGGWTISSDVSYSHAKSDFNNGVSWGLLYNDMSATNPVAANDEVVDYQLNGMQPGTVGFNHDYTDLSRMGLGKVGVYPYVYDDESKAFRTDVRYDFVDNSFLSALEMGVRYSRRTYNADRSAFEYGNDFGQYPAGQPPLALDPSNAHKVCFEGNLSSFPCFLSIDTLAVLAANGITPTPTKNWNANWTMIQSAEVDEHVSSGYVMADIDTNVANHNLTGNVGVRVVHTSQYSNGLQQIGSGQGEPITDELGVTSTDYIHVRRGKSYTDYLPSLNLNWHFDESNQLRFAAAKVMSRPPLNKLLTGSGSWIDGNTYNMWGNTSPFLDPFYAKQYDLSFEHYSPDSSGAFAAALFFKHIDSFIEDYTINPYDFAGNGIQVPINPATGLPYENGQYQTAVNNDKGGFVRGVELSYSRVFNFLPGAWSGLGFTGSYSYSQSQVTSTSTLGGAPQKMGLPGLSPRVINGTLFYGYQGFDTRLSVRHRSAFVSNQMAVDTQIVYYAPETVVDYQASYAFKNGLSVLFQVNNLTDEPTRTYFGNEAQTGTLQWFGRQYLVGFTYAL
ncbi:TonB-dependent receptor [Frateuria edaphi]|uniref:TonB-dependent receptor n=1 Tax=Frateuria edaphi TaxID=2898793 RepID=UPI001E5EA94E|nr:TonB-dependent receptor [Frateuria edaphi]UGB47157.1 TonB-dependent receptor [Frateuria edaphi]